MYIPTLLKRTINLIDFFMMIVQRDSTEQNERKEEKKEEYRFVFTVGPENSVKEKENSSQKSEPLKKYTNL